MTDPVKYVDADSNEFEFETEDAGSGKTRPVHGLASSITTVLSAIKTATEAVAAIISAGKLAVADAGIAAIISGGKLAVSDATLEALVSASKLAVADSAVASALATLHTDIATTLVGYVDGLEGFVDNIETLITSTNTKLDTLIADVVAGGNGAVSTTYQEQKTAIGTGSNVSFTTQALTRGMWIQNVSAAGQIIYVAITGTPSNTNGIWLYPGEKVWADVNNANVPIMRASASSGIANMWGW
jgi:hypothetical protein